MEEQQAQRTRRKFSDEFKRDAAAIVRPLIQSLWIGDRLSTMERLCITSFLEHGHPFHLYVYDEVANAPSGVILEDAAEIMPRDKIFRYKGHDSVAGFADLFRYQLLLERGSYWVDTDEICLTPFPSEPEYVFASQATQRAKRYTRPRPPQVNVNILKAPPGSEIFGYCFDAASRRNSDDLVWGEMGPKLISEAVEKFGLRDFVADHRDYCPVDWWQFQRLIQPNSLGTLFDKLRMALQGPRGIHLWNEMWRRNSLEKDAEYPRSSIYEKLKRRYDVTC